MNSLLISLAVFLATGFYLSTLPNLLLERIFSAQRTGTLKEKKWTGAGFIGSVIGVSTYLLLPFEWVQSYWVIGIFALVAIISAHAAENFYQTKDDSRIIIDEWFGAWVACFGLAQTLNWEIVLAFILFRVFDVWKGPLIKPFQKVAGGLGVVLDDLVAGLLARFTIFLLKTAFFF